MTDLVLLGMLLFALSGAWALAVPLLRERRLRALEHQADDAQCWVCSGMVLRSIGPDTFECVICGNLQGDGARGAERTASQAAYAKLGPKVREELARRWLGECELEFIAVEGELNSVLELSVADIRRDDLNVSEEKLSRFARALSSLASLEQKLVDVAVVLADQAHLDRLTSSTTTLEAIMDELDIDGFTRSDRRTQHEIAATIAHLPRLRALQTRLQRRLQSFSG